MNWWNAENFCAAHTGKSMISLGSSGLNCPYGAMDYHNNGNSGVCCADNKSGIRGICGTYDTVTADAENVVASLSSGIQAAVAAGVPTSVVYWTQNLTEVDSCSAFTIGLDAGYVGHNARNYKSRYDYYALCK